MLLSLEIANTDGSSDAPTFSLLVFDDGCYQYQGKSMATRLFAMGRTSEGVVEAILHDATTFQFQSFAEKLNLEDGLGPDLRLTISTDDGKRSVRYTPIVDSDRAQLAVALGPVKGQQLIFAHMFGQRILDLVPEMR